MCFLWIIQEPGGACYLYATVAGALGYGSVGIITRVQPNNQRKLKKGDKVRVVVVKTLCQRAMFMGLLIMWFY